MLRYLLNFWFTPILGMMFAAGAGVLDGAAGGADGGADSGGSGTGGVDQLDNDSGADDASADGGNSDDGSASRTDGLDGDQQTDGSSADTQSRAASTLDAKWKKAFELAKAAGVEKEVKQAFFGIQRLTKVIPGGVNGAIELAKAVEEFGGVDGVQQLQADLETHREDAELFERADPRWVESGFTENPEAALKLFAHTLDYVADKHSEQYDHLMAKVIVNDLDQSLPVRDIHALLVGMKDNPAAQELAKKLAAYYNARRETSQKVPEKKVDAQQKALTDRQTTLDKKEMDLRFTEVNREVLPQMKIDVTKTLRAEAKLGGIDLDKLSAEYPTEWRDMLGAIHKRINAGAMKDQRFLDKHYALVKKGDLKRAAAAVNAKHAAIIPDIARAVMQSYGVFKGKKPVAGDKGNQNAGARPDASQNQGWTRVSAKPQNSTIDYRRTTAAMQLDGKYILNDGKQVIVNY